MIWRVLEIIRFSGIAGTGTIGGIVREGKMAWHNDQLHRPHPPCVVKGDEAHIFTSHYVMISWGIVAGLINFNTCRKR